MKSNSKAAVGHNIATEMAAGAPQKQAVAIALSEADRAAGKTPPRKGKKRAPPPQFVRKMVVR